jgi:Na+/glutamate symporter
MHSYSSYSSGIGAGIPIVAMVAIVLLFCYVIACFMAMYYIGEAAAKKGWGSTGGLWFIGLFATPVTPALIAAITPDKNEAKKAAEDDLPAI